MAWRQPTSVPSLGCRVILWRGSEASCGRTPAREKCDTRGRANGGLHPTTQLFPSQVFLGYTTAGSSFVFGNTLIKDVFAFQVSLGSGVGEGKAELGFLLASVGPAEPGAGFAAAELYQLWGGSPLPSLPPYLPPMDLPSDGGNLHCSQSLPSA